MTQLVSELLVIVMAFGAVTVVVFIAGQYMVTQGRLQRRATSTRSTQSTSDNDVLKGLQSVITSYFDEKRFQMEGPARAKIRQDLVRAGYFSVDAIRYYIFARVVAVTATPVVAYIAIGIEMAGYDWRLKLVLVLVALLLGFLLPDAYIARRQRHLVEKYRNVFPDMLDLMVVCVDAGLSLEGAFERLSSEITKRNREFGMNLLLLGAETRAGRTTAEALVSFADRLNLDEARSFAGMLSQSMELGTDVATALRVYSDEMRDRRLLRAEEKANQLPVKMVLPLGLFIFPVILGIVMVPVAIKLMTIVAVTK